MSLTSGAQCRSPATIRGYHLTLRMFCDYVTSAQYGWLRECAEWFDKVPSQICFDYNTVAHLQDYEGRPERRPFSDDELEGFPHEEHPRQYLLVANHLMQRNAYPPPFVDQLVAAMAKVAPTDAPLARATLSI